MIFWSKLIMKFTADTDRVKIGLKEAILLLCKTGLTFQSELTIEGLLGITLDHNQVFLVNIKEVIKSEPDFQVTSSGCVTESPSKVSEPFRTSDDSLAESRDSTRDDEGSLFYRAAHVTASPVFPNNAAGPLCPSRGDSPSIAGSSRAGGSTGARFAVCATLSPQTDACPPIDLTVDHRSVALRRAAVCKQEVDQEVTMGHRGVTGSDWRDELKRENWRPTRATHSPVERGAMKRQRVLSPSVHVTEGPSEVIVVKEEVDDTRTPPPPSSFSLGGTAHPMSVYDATDFRSQWLQSASSRLRSLHAPTDAIHPSYRSLIAPLLQPQVRPLIGIQVAPLHHDFHQY